jgi:hypothetical protein
VVEPAPRITRDIDVYVTLGAQLERELDVLNDPTTPPGLRTLAGRAAADLTIAVLALRQENDRIKGIIEREGARQALAKKQAECKHGRPIQTPMGPACGKCGAPLSDLAVV